MCNVVQSCDSEVNHYARKVEEHRSKYLEFSEKVTKLYFLH